MRHNLFFTFLFFFFSGISFLETSYAGSGECASFPSGLTVLDAEEARDFWQLCTFGTYTAVTYPPVFTENQAFEYECWDFPEQVACSLGIIPEPPLPDVSWFFVTWEEISCVDEYVFLTLNASHDTINTFSSFQIYDPTDDGGWPVGWIDGINWWMDWPISDNVSSPWVYSLTFQRDLNYSLSPSVQWQIRFPANSVIASDGSWNTITNSAPMDGIISIADDCTPTNTGGTNTGNTNTGSTGSWFVPPTASGIYIPIFTDTEWKSYYVDFWGTLALVLFSFVVFLGLLLFYWIVIRPIISPKKHFH